MRAGLVGGALVVIVSVLAGTPAFAETPSPPLSPPPSTGFVPPYEIMRIVRGAGFEPLAPPLREGTTYIVRAIDFTGASMRVVIDAHSGAIRDTNRIASGPDSYPGSDRQVGMAYRAPAEDMSTPFVVLPNDLPQTGGDGATMHAIVENPPLPRPRPEIRPEIRPATLARTAATGKAHVSNKASD